MEITLTKTRNYKLEPYGKFVIKFKTRQQHIPNIIPVDELHIKHETGMPMSAEQEKQIVQLMKKSKTDILTDGYGTYYTRVGSDLTEVWHKKLSMYRDDTAFKQAVDLGQSFGKIVMNNA
jgi:hypothetical protein